MHDQRCSSLFGVFLAILLALMLLSVFACDRQPTGLGEIPGEGDLAGIGEIDLGAGGSFLLGTVTDTTLAPGYLEIWAMDVAYDTQTGIVSFDVQLGNQTRRNIPPPIQFVITEIMPPSIAVLEFDGTSWDGFPFYDFSSKLGDDDILQPGERTERVTMRFHTARPRSFAIGFRIDLGPPPGGGMILGIVYRDDNRNGARDRSDLVEPGIPGITVFLEKTLEGGDKVLLLARTDVNGEYRFGGLREGVYKVGVSIAPEMWEVTSTNPLLITLVKGPDGEVQDFFGASFGLFPLHAREPHTLFGPVAVGPGSPVGTLLDSTFIDSLTPLPVVYSYYLNVMRPPFLATQPGIIDSASTWINDTLVFEYHRSARPDSAFFVPQTILLPEGLVKTGENAIRLFTDGPERAVLLWWVYKEL